ncbi:MULTISPECIES: cohesin domain-containing protein [Ruminococcus]|uniref:Uncharacterized protein n=1 Tax=Ruminococcus bovis TaxID=2564099 RepID=A0A4P8XVD9_9FIRM|nr:MULTISPECIES: cohesin domain-containing protein [Ruminococcus]MEE3438873.1 cohesin domain-containing protein [Ruminococcus sp.]QCT06374.1 hypothetical protein E5Z56_02980 [Ruminococcus bovis]
MTKRISAVVLALLMCLLTLAFSVTSFSAAENLKLNGKVNAKVGDKVTYEFCVSDVPEKTEDIQMQVAYDSQYLKVDPDKVEYLDGGSSVYNTDLENEVLFNSANGVQGWDMKEKTMILSLTFEVLQGGSTDITYYVQCFDYQSNSQNVDTLQFTTDFLVNGKTAEKNVVPKVNEKGEGGTFINFENGKGTKNGGDTPIGRQYSGKSNNDQTVNNNGEAVDNNASVATDANGNTVVNTTAYQATTESTAMRTNSSGQNVTDSNGKEVSYTDSDNFWRNLGIMGIVALIVIVIVIKVIVDKKKSKKEE